MNKSVIYLTCLMLLFSCSSNTAKKDNFVLESKIFENDGKYLIVPLLYGCDGCVQKTYEFIKQNHFKILNSNNFYVVWTQIKNKRQIQRDYDQKFLKNFVTDSSNVLSSEIDSYPVLIEVESGYIKHKITLSPDNLDSELVNLKNYLGK